VERLLIVAAALAAAALLAWWWRRRDGRVVTGGARFSRAQLDALGVPPDRLALVEVTAPHCAPCVTARRVLDRVADGHGAVVVTVDADDEIARAHRVLRVPTTFVVAADGAVQGRISGVPAHNDVQALIHQARSPVD
jgi:hypothetical protein